MKHIALAVIVAVTLSGCGRNAAEELVAAERALAYRPVEGRLSGSPYAMPPNADRNVTALVKGDLLKLGAPDQPDELRARALLLVGQRDAAENLLRKLAARRDASAATLSDYAATLHAAAAPGDVLQLSMALAAADRAHALEPLSPEVLFNRAVILDALSLRDEAAATCIWYLNVDSSSRWAMEIRKRLRDIQAAQSRIAARRTTAEDLERAAEVGDELFINDVATAHPEEARRSSDVYLARWGERVLDKDPKAAASMLLLCRVIGRALERRGDSLLADTVRAIEANVGSQEELATAHVEYERGLRAAQRHDSTALRAFEQARKRFIQHGSPMAHSARFYMAVGLGEKNSITSMVTVDECRNHFRQHSAPMPLPGGVPLTIAAGECASATILRDLASNLPQRYRALHAQIQLQLARSGMGGGQLPDVFRSLRSATATFEALGEHQQADATRRLTTLLQASGNNTPAWRLRHAMSSAAETHHDFYLMSAVYEAARDAISDDRWDIAYSLLNVVASGSDHHARLREEAIVWRALAASRAGMPLATGALSVARATLGTTTDLRLVASLVADDKRETVAVVTQLLGYADNATESARLLVARARVLRDLREPQRAQDDLERAVELLEGGHVIIASNKVRGRSPRLAALRVRHVGRPTGPAG